MLSLAGSCFAQGSVLMVGGGRENYSSWSDDPYRWFVQQADSGIIINIDVDAASDWYPSYFESFGADTGSQNIQIATRTAANDSMVYKKLVAASGIFMEGGDQWDYVYTWRGTLVEQAIHEVFARGGAIGGTSAGLAVLGGVVFDASKGSAYPEETAYDPYNNRISLTDDFLEILPDVLTDSHFHSRGRIGRLVPMLARRITDNGENDLIGIGVADKTALCVDPDRVATAYGQGSVTILFRDANSVIRCEAGQPITFTDIHFDQLIDGAVYDLKKRQLVHPGAYLKEVSPQFPAEPVYIDTVVYGSEETSARLGDVVVENILTGDLNAWYGRLSLSSGDHLIPGCIIIPRLWSDPDIYENRIVGGMYALAENPGCLVVYIDDNSRHTVDQDGMLQTDKFAMILDGSGMTHAGFNAQYSTNYCGIIGGRLHFLGASDRYDIPAHGAVTTLPEKKSPVAATAGFVLIDNFPNPFNACTTIRYCLYSKVPAKLKIYNTLGRIVYHKDLGVQPPGLHSVVWDAGEVSTGVYYYCIQVEGRSKFGRCIYLK